MFFKQLQSALLLVILVYSSISFADDTELYLIDSDVSKGKRPQVLFIFDNSGSMSTEDQNSTSNYCAKNDNSCQRNADFITYAQGYSGYINEKGIYWNTGGIDNTSSMPTPDVPKDSRRFYAANNNCNTAVKALETKGRYTGFLREFSKSGNTGVWVQLAENNGFNPNQAVDCLADITKEDPKNPGTNKSTGTMYVDGYPVNIADQYKSGSAGLDLSRDGDFGNGTPVTLYSADYLVWHKWASTTDAGQNSGGASTRLEVAKQALTTALEGLDIPIDAGLAVFNLNYPTEGNADGGRIVSSVKEMDSTNQASLISLINGMPAKTNTPLCETLYESYLYFSGRAINFGDNDNKGVGNQKIQSYTPNSPASIISSGNYTSPFKKCPDTAYIIYITDGAPTLDHSADSLIHTLTQSAENQADYSAFDFLNAKGETETSYMPALAAYMVNNDLIKGIKDVNGIDNKQNVKLFTIGFSSGADAAAALLEEAAHRGGTPRVSPATSKGYKVAGTGLDLVEVLNDTLKSILAIDSSFTSPSIASNNFDRTQTYNSAYFTMFLPGAGPRWSGNLKKLKVNSNGEIVGPGGSDKAIDSKGSIASTTCTYWNTCLANDADGNKVNSGGVLPHLRTKLKTRNIKTISSSAIVDIDISSFVSSYSQTDLDWLYGVDVDDDNNNNSLTDARMDIMGDPLHSKPLAINFGEKPNDDGSESLDVRVIFGTNQGLVHMFKDTEAGSDGYGEGSVIESWALIPSELWKNVPTLRQNNPTGEHSVYGMDLSPVAYTETDSDGKVNKAYLFLGMRRGGASYYAIDITTPDNPSFMWMINSDTNKYEDLGQTWSEPVATLVPGVSEPVVIFGGGMASSDGSGEGIYIADAKNGGDPIKIFTATGMSSIAAKVATLDSNNDGITDRLYATDISGNVWRMDMPSADKSTWSIFKFASIGGTSPYNRMFFAEATVAQTQFNNIHKGSDGTLSYQNTPYDAVTIGSGNRTHPLDVTTSDMFFVFQDRNVVTKTFSGTNIPLTLSISDLYNVTSASPESQSENITFSSKRGWYYDFPSLGEKSLSSSLIFDGKVYFTSFVPPTNNQVDFDLGVCGFSGQGRLYVFDLHKGTRSYSQVYFDVGERVPDTPQIVVPKPEDGEESKAYIIVGKGECENGECKGTVALNNGLTTNKIYYHIEE
jgi:type IV pilus assembly protein PilY1